MVNTWVAVLKLQYIIITFSVNSFEYYYSTLLCFFFSYYTKYNFNNNIYVDYRPRGGPMTSINPIGIPVSYYYNSVFNVNKNKN